MKKNSKEKAENKVTFITTVHEMKAWEPIILDRIKKLPNGGILYTLHPFCLLRDLGFKLSESLVEQLMDQQPRLRHLDEKGYYRIRGVSPLPDVHIKIGKLFPEHVKG